ncbi:MAG: hypothetical protein GYA56_00410 [Geobacteraceae bacterium]|nr:hypothetical protein [Geobacteraceae bacterium]
MKKGFCLAIGMMMVSCLVLAGCKKAGEKAAEKAIEAGLAKEGVKADVDASDGKVTIRGKDGTTEFAGGKNVKVPESFPKDVYVYEGATIDAALSVPGGFNLTMETADPAETVLSTVKKKMTGQGWKEEMTMNQGEQSMVGYKKGERTTMITITTDKKLTRIALTVTEEKGK